MPRGAAAYDDDDLDYDDDYDEAGEEELSPEDKAAMNEATAAVRKSLGADFTKIPIKQVQDSLWHYYYDVDKTVGYLKKTYLAAPTPKPTPKKVPEGMSSKLSYVALQNHTMGWGADQNGPFDRSHSNYRGALENSLLPLDGPLPPTSCPDPMFLRSVFQDMPWLNTPQHRQTVFIEPTRPRGGLLGGGDGAPKMSKLQALAAARKKKTEEKKNTPKAEATNGAEGDMKRLSLADKKENERPGFVKRQKTSDHDSSIPQNLQPQPAAAPVAAAPSPPERAVSDVEMKTSHNEDEAVIAAAVAPSAFARTLFGSAPPKPQRDVFSMPYANSSSFVATAFAKPSPDDVVLTAQAQAGKKTQAAPKAAKGKESKENQVASGVAALKINDVPPPKSKGLDVVKEFEKSEGKRSVSFVVVGHVDAGKSTLMGRLLVELKHVEQRTVDKYRRLAEKSGKQSFALAWVMDQRDEERDRGVTIDIATSRFETEKTKFTILDAPGHRDFVPNMIAGASQADFAILVIDGNTGAYEKGLKGQTREHVLLLRSLGVQRLIIAVNKLDMVGWSKERFDEISQQVGAFLTGLGFLEKFVTFVPISGLNGDNIAKPIENPAASWYQGATLVDALEASEATTKRALTKPFRFGISEVFRSQQGTTTLAGRVDSGTFQIGDAILVQPSGETAYVKSVAVDGQSQDWAVAGQNVSIALTDIDPVHIRVGDILCHAAEPMNCGDTFTMKAMAFEHLMPMPVDLHRGRLHAPGQIQSMVATIDKTTGQVLKKKPKVVQPGAVARITIKVSGKVPLEAGQRVVIRSAGETVAAGLLE